MQINEKDTPNSKNVKTKPRHNMEDHINVKIEAVDKKMMKVCQLMKKVLQTQKIVEQNSKIFKKPMMFKLNIRGT